MGRRGNGWATRSTLQGRFNAALKASDGQRAAYAGQLERNRESLERQQAAATTGAASGSGYDSLNRVSSFYHGNTSVSARQDYLHVTWKYSAIGIPSWDTLTYGFTGMFADGQDTIYDYTGLPPSGNAPALRFGGILACV